MMKAELTYDRDGHGTLKLDGIDVTDHAHRHGVSLKGGKPPVLTVEFLCSSVDLDGILDINPEFPTRDTVTASQLVGKHDPITRFGCGYCDAAWNDPDYRHTCTAKSFPTDGP